MNTTQNETFKTTCSYCGVGCGIKITKNRYNEIELTGDESHPVNMGMLCSKGRSLNYVVQDKQDRLLHPQMRWNKHLPLENVSWDTALERASAVFKTFIKKHGPDSVGLYVSGQCLTEEYYLANKLTKGFLQTNNIDTNSRLCMSSAVVGYKKILGEDSVPIAYEDIELSDCMFITGANPAWCHPILFRRIETHKENNPDLKIIVVDPRKTQTCALADIHLQIQPGTDTYLYNAIGRILIEENFTDIPFIEKYVDGYDAYEKGVMAYSVEEAAQICQVDINDIYETARYIGKSKGFLSFWAMGLNQSVVGVNKNLALITLSLITGKIGKPGNGPFSLTGQPNAMGGREVGGLSNMLAAHKDFTNPEHRKEVAQHWGVNSVPEKPGLSATEMMEALDSGKMKAIWIVCTNPMVSLPQSRFVEQALKKANFVIVQDISAKADTLEHADIVFPAAGWMEKEGTMTNSERRVSHLPKIIDAPGEALPDSEIFIRFAQKMGFGDQFDYKNIEEVYLEHAKLTKGTNLDVSGVTYDILKNKNTVQWPFTEGADEGTARLFTDNVFFTPNKKAQLFEVPPANQSEELSPDFPFVLTTGRIRDQWHTMTRTGKVNKLNQHIAKPFLEIHPEDALAQQIKDGDIVRIYNVRGDIQVIAKVTDEIKKGVVFLPMHWGKKLQKDLSRTNNLTQPLVDPVSKEPDFKFSAVNVVKYKKPKEKIIIVGAGAAAYQFIKSYREQNERDEIEIFCKEPVAFYNRVLLPEYISGHREWENLLKSDQTEEDELQIKVHTNNEVVKIDKENKKVTDKNGIEHTYDSLILCTGSRAFIPPNVPKTKGIYTLRTRKDADDIGTHASQKGNVIIVGGGVLGIELADSLVQMGVEVTMIQRSNRLMERQLDQLGSEILDLELRDRGINILYTDEVKSLDIDDHFKGVRLKSGRYLSSEVIVYAIGTRPNIEIAKESGLNCGRGVIVNDQLTTSDSSIFALGEIAQHNHMLYGITASAEEQARYLASFMLGDYSTAYQGSLLMNILKVEGVQLASIGEVEKPANDDSYEEVFFIDKKRRYYKKALIKDDKLVGCILAGDKTEFNEYRELIQNQIELGEKRQEILNAIGQPKEVIGELICSCNNVGKGNLENEIKDGCHDFKTLCQKTGAGTGCGSCKTEVKTILETELASMNNEVVEEK